MKVSAAVPCYNEAGYIGQTIESLLSQTCPINDILVVDDGSTDDSVEVIRRYPVRLLQHKHNEGLSAARNTAISAATGDVLAFIDADATADPEWIEMLLSGYNATSNIAGVGGQGVESNVLSVADRWRKIHASQSHGSKPRDVEFLFGLCMSFRTSALRKVGGFDEAFRTNGEDMEIGIRLNKAGFRLRYLPNAKVYHQRTDDRQSLKRTMSAWYTAAYRAKYVNKYQPWRVIAGTLRRLVCDPLSDLVIRRDSALALLSWQIGWRKLYALRKVMVELDT